MIEAPEILFEIIGQADHGLDSGNDVYYLVWRKDGEDLDANDAAYAMREHAYIEHRGPGTRYCNSISSVHKPYSDKQVICIAHVRYDV
jgi:hypothetical protein